MNISHPCKKRKGGAALCFRSFGDKVSQPAEFIRPRTPRALLQEVDAKQVGLDRVPRTDEVAGGQGRRYIDLID